MEVFRKEALNSYLMISNLDNSIGYFVEVYAINSFGSSKQSMRISIPAEDKVRIVKRRLFHKKKVEVIALG